MTATVDAREAAELLRALVDEVDSEYDRWALTYVNRGAHELDGVKATVGHLRAVLDRLDRLEQQSARDTRAVRSMVRLFEHGDCSGVGEAAVAQQFADRITELAAREKDSEAERG